MNRNDRIIDRLLIHYRYQKKISSDGNYLYMRHSGYKSVMEIIERVTKMIYIEPTRHCLTLIEIDYILGIKKRIYLENYNKKTCKEIAEAIIPYL